MSFSLMLEKRTFEKSENNLNDMNLNHGKTQRSETYENLFRAKPVDFSTVILAIKHLKTINSTGSDGIALRYIHDILSVIANYITTISNTSSHREFSHCMERCQSNANLQKRRPERRQQLAPHITTPNPIKGTRKNVAQQLTTYSMSFCRS